MHHSATYNEHDKKFTHNLIEFPKLTRSSSNGQRYYNTPAGKSYPSVTTITSQLNKQAIINWRNKVGDEQANKISTQASRHGTKVHDILENYLSNNLSPDVYKDNPVAYDNFLKIKQKVDQHINNVYAIEATMYSDSLMLAGTVDLIAEYKGKLSIIDWKTAKKPKKPEWIKNYFVQAAAYKTMFEQHTPYKIEQLVIIIAVQDHGPQIFKIDNPYHIQSLDSTLISLRDNFFDKNNIVI